MQLLKFVKDSNGTPVMECGQCGNTYHAWSLVVTAEGGVHVQCMNCSNKFDLIHVVLTAAEVDLG